MADRRCPCGTILSRYNPESLCAVHLEAERLRVLAAESEAIRLGEIREREREERASNRKPSGVMPAPGTQTRRVLDALPGTMPEVAAKTGLEHRVTSRVLGRLIFDGHVRAEGEKGGYGAGAKRMYRAVERRQDAA